MQALSANNFGSAGQSDVVTWAIPAKVVAKARADFVAGSAAVIGNSALTVNGTRTPHKGQSRRWGCSRGSTARQRRDKTADTVIDLIRKAKGIPRKVTAALCMVDKRALRCHARAPSDET
jgi:hypothetical protein